MKTIIKTVLTLLLLGIVLTNTAMAADDHETGKSFLQNQVDNMDPAIQPYGQLVADNIVAIFLFCGGVFLLIDSVMSSYKRKQGKTTEAAWYKNDTVETAKQLGLGIILFGIFVAVVKSKTIGLV